MTKFAAISLCLAAMLVAVECSSTGECPTPSTVATCTPKCSTDQDCSSIRGKCCANSCNQKSCIEYTKLANADKFTSNVGTYCGNIKCNPYEKCDIDRATKRQKCVRA
ncbi:WAP four-disulfide core domain protein 12-like [Anopheles albimanus]|uniref:WAP four-disulfide core domain protein 12-like n=1 Tax=Anopheles albimanus TaxID=7167 RepID=UPI00163FB8E9|nr:WAP four-disulfide core domain protein 12-like [Anopheles albimanus]